MAQGITRLYSLVFFFHRLHCLKPQSGLAEIDTCVCVPPLCLTTKPSGSDRNVQARSSPGLYILNFSIWDISLWLSCVGLEFPPWFCICTLYFIFVIALHVLLANMLRIGAYLGSINEKFFIMILFVKVSFNCCETLGSLGSMGSVTRPSWLGLLSNGHSHKISRGLKTYTGLNDGIPTSSWSIEQNSVPADIIQWLDGI